MASLAPTMPKSKSKKAKSKKPAKSKKAPIPPGFRTVTPYLAINGAAAAIDWYKKAFDAGAKVTMPLDNMFWGERYGQLTDPYGHHWSISQLVSMTKKEKDEKQKQAMAMFARNEHPGRTEEPQVVQN